MGLEDTGRTHAATTASPLGVALIGQRFMGRAHSNGWGQANRFFDLQRPIRMRTICARNAEELAPFAKRFGWESWTTDWRTIADDAEIDLVDVGTPNDVHAEQSIAMLQAGKHVACEKPLAATLDEARRMAEAARDADGKTFVWFNYRRIPAVVLAHQWIREGRLGRLLHVRARYLQSWGGADTPRVWRFEKSRAGSGAHGDLNAHIIDMARFLTGLSFEAIDGAIARTFYPERPMPDGKGVGTSDVDDALSFLASMEGGVAASFEATRCAPGHLNDHGIEINGELGSLRFDFNDMNYLSVHEAGLGDGTGGWKRIAATSAGDHAYAAEWWPDGHWIGYEHGFVNMAADIVRVLAGEEPTVPIPDFADAYETQRVLEASMRAATEHRRILLDDVR